MRTWTVTTDSGGPRFKLEVKGTIAEIRALVDGMFMDGKGYTTVMAATDGYEYARMAWR